MATSAKTASDKPVPAARSASENPEEDSAKPKGKKKLLVIIIGVLVLVSAAGAGWYFTKGGTPADEAKAISAPPSEPPKFVTLEPFTVNLQREAADQFLQIGITLKIADASLEERIALAMPEIRSHLLVLLSGKYPSELSSTGGKKKLVHEIITEIDTVLGLNSGTAQPAATGADEESAPGEDKSASASGKITSDAAEPDATAPDDAADQAADETAPAEEAQRAGKKGGIVDVLFTSFIIQ